MVEPIDYDDWCDRSSIASLLNTLHDLGVIDDEIFDHCLTELYERYGGDYARTDWSDDYL